MAVTAGGIPSSASRAASGAVGGAVSRRCFPQPTRNFGSAGFSPAASRSTNDGTRSPFIARRALQYPSSISTSAPGGTSSPPNSSVVRTRSHVLIIRTRNLRLGGQVRDRAAAVRVANHDLRVADQLQLERVARLGQVLDASAQLDVALTELRLTRAREL